MEVCVSDREMRTVKKHHEPLLNVEYPKVQYKHQSCFAIYLNDMIE